MPETNDLSDVRLRIAAALTGAGFEDVTILDDEFDDEHHSIMCYDPESMHDLAIVAAFA